MNERIGSWMEETVVTEGVVEFEGTNREVGQLADKGRGGGGKRAWVGELVGG